MKPTRKPRRKKKLQHTPLRGLETSRPVRKAKRPGTVKQRREVILDVDAGAPRGGFT